MNTDTSVTTINSMNAVELFQGNKIEELLDAITAEVRSEVGDPSSEKGRAQIKSLAHKVAKSKTAIDSLGKDLVADWKTKSKEVDAIRKGARERLDALKEEVRQPVTDWENAEEHRVSAIKERIDEIQNLACEFDPAGQPFSLEGLSQSLAQLTSCDIDESFQELRAIAQKTKDDVLASLKNSIEVAERIKAEADELERLRKEEEARQETERKRLVAEREAKIAKEAAETAKRIAEEKAAAELAEEKRKAEDKAAREKQEAERELQIAREDQVRAEKALADAEEKRLREIAEQKKAETDRENAVKAERDRIKQESIEAAREAKMREENKEHRRKINKAAKEALIAGGVNELSAELAIKLIAKGSVPNVSIRY